MKAMHPTMAAVKSASLALDEAIKARDEAVKAAYPGYDDARLAASVTRSAAKEKAKELKVITDAAKAVKDEHAAKIGALQAELEAARTARAEYLKTQPKRAKKGKAG